MADQQVEAAPPALDEVEGSESVDNEEGPGLNRNDVSSRREAQRARLDEQAQKVADVRQQLRDEAEKRFQALKTADKAAQAPKPAVTKAPPPAAVVQSTPKAEPAPPASPDVAASLFAQVAEASKAVEAAKAEAQTHAVRAQAAEKLLQEMQELAARDPHGFLKAQKMDAEKFTARLLRGGELTEGEKAEQMVEKARAEFDSKLKAIDEAHRKAEFTRTAGLLGPALEKEFPLTAKEHGAEKALQHLLSEKARLGRSITPQEAFAAEEKRLREHYTSRAELLGLKAHVAVAAAAPKPQAKTVDTSKVTPSTARKVREELAAQMQAKWNELRSLGRTA